MDRVTKLMIGGWMNLRLSSLAQQQQSERCRRNYQGLQWVTTSACGELQATAATHSGSTATAVHNERRRYVTASCYGKQNLRWANRCEH